MATIIFSCCSRITANKADMLNDNPPSFAIRRHNNGENVFSLLANEISKIPTTTKIQCLVISMNFHVYLLVSVYYKVDEADLRLVRALGDLDHLPEGQLTLGLFHLPVALGVSSETMFCWHRFWLH